jgi:SAM-dependent methyltransferase
MAVVEGRQWAPTVAEIRPDHVNRYRWAAEWLKGHFEAPRVLDAACGIGYGSAILARAGCRVDGIDVSQRALDYAAEHYPHERTRYLHSDVLQHRGAYDAVVSFETLEHVADAQLVLERFAGQAPWLLVSVPNETVLPFDPGRHQHHRRHYTTDDLRGALGMAGYGLDGLFTQIGKTGPVEPGQHGQTLIAVAARAIFR